MTRILFVCHGNICRSPMAEFVFRDLVKKAGLDGEVLTTSLACRSDEIGSDMHLGSQRVLTEHGVPFAWRAAQKIRRVDLDHYDIIIAMDEENMVDLLRLGGDKARRKCHLLLSYAGEGGPVADPWYTGDFETAYRDILRGCKGLLSALQK